MNPLPEILASFPVIDRQTAFWVALILGLVIGFCIGWRWRQL